MPLETATWFEDLVPTNPLGTDPKAQGDDHLRLIKQVIQNQWPVLGAEACNVTAAALNAALSVPRAFVGPSPLSGTVVDIALPNDTWRKATIHIIGTTQGAGTGNPQLRLGTGGVPLETGVYDCVVARHLDAATDSTVGGIVQNGFPLDIVEDPAQQNYRFTVERIGATNLYYWTNQGVRATVARGMTGAGVVDLGGLCDLLRFVWVGGFTAGTVYAQLDP